MSKFIIGEIIEPLGNEYVYTSKRNEAVCEVVSTFSGDDIEVKIIEGLQHVGKCFIVNSYRFKIKGLQEEEDKEVLKEKFMVYGTGCNKKSDFVDSEKELKEKLKKLSKNTNWTGRIIGYKLTPIYEAQETVVIKGLPFKTKKAKKVKKR